MHNVTLYGFWRSSCAHRVRIALALKGVAYTARSVHLGRREQLQADFLAINPAGQLPVLDIDGQRLTQSVAILRALERRWPTPQLFPSDAAKGDRVEEIVERINSFIQPFQMPGSVRRALLAHQGLEDDAGVVRFVSAHLRDALGLLDEKVRASAGAFCVGDEVTAADVLLVPQLDGAERFGVAVGDLATLGAIRARCMEPGAFQAAAGSPPDDTAP